MLPLRLTKGVQMSCLILVVLPIDFFVLLYIIKKPILGGFRHVTRHARPMRVGERGVSLRARLVGTAIDSQTI